jgi:hypothetical protein
VAAQTAVAAVHPKAPEDMLLLLLLLLPGGGSVVAPVA